MVTAGPNSSVSITTGTDDFAGVFGVAELTGGQSVLVGVTTTANDSGDGGSTDTGLQVAVVDNGHVSLAIVPMPSGTTPSADYIGGAAVTALTNGDFAVLYWGDNASDGANVPQSGANGNLPGYYVQVFSSNGTTVGNPYHPPTERRRQRVRHDRRGREKQRVCCRIFDQRSSSDIIQRFSNSGSAGDSFEMPASFAPYNIAVDGDGNIFAQYDDASNNDVYAYIPDGATSIASTGVLIDQALPSSDYDGNPEFVGVSGGGFVGFFFDGNNLAAETTSANGTLSSEITLGDVGSAITSTDHPWISVALADGYFALTLDPISSENFSGSLTGLPGTNQVIEVGPALTAADTTVYDLTDSSGSPIEFGPYVVADPQGGLLSYTDVASSFSAQGYPLDASVTAVSYLDPGPSIGGAGNTIQYYQGGAATPLDSSITVTDLQGADISSATVTISTGFQSGDTLSFNNGSPTQTFSDSATVSASQSGDVLTLTTTAGNATAADYQKALDSVTYSFSGDPTIGGTDRTRTITWSVTDADGQTSAAGSTTTLDVYVTPALAAGNGFTAPVVTTSAAVFANSDLTLTDVNTTGSAPVATVTISGGSDTGDTLSFNNETPKTFGDDTITPSYNSGTHVLTLTGTAGTSPSEFQTALEGVDFDTTATNSNDGVRTLTWSFNDDAGNSTNPSNSLTTNIDVEFPPTIGGTGNTAQFYQIPNNNSGIILDSGITVTDPNVDITSATVTISSGYLSGDTLGFNKGTDTEHFGPTAGSPEGSTITATQNGDTLTLTTTSGTDTASDYQNVLESVTYDFTGDPTDAGADKSRTITWSVSDTNGQTSVGGSTSTLGVFAQPIVTVGVAGTPQETSTSGPVFADSTLSITDYNGTTIHDASVQITSGDVPSDTLTINGTTSGSINDGVSGTISYSFTGTTLTLTGTDTVADYTTALDEVKFDAVSPNSGTRSLSWQVNDEAGGNTNDSVPVTTNVDVAFGPELTGGQNFGETEGTSTGPLQLVTFTELRDREPDDRRFHGGDRLGRRHGP